MIWNILVAMEFYTTFCICCCCFIYFFLVIFREGENPISRPPSKNLFVNLEFFYEAVVGCASIFTKFTTGRTDGRDDNYLDASSDAGQNIFTSYPVSTFCKLYVVISTKKLT